MTTITFNPAKPLGETRRLFELRYADPNTDDGIGADPLGDLAEEAYNAVGVVLWLADNPANHDQGTWMAATINGTCKTAGCFAGWTVPLLGHLERAGHWVRTNGQWTTETAAVETVSISDAEHSRLPVDTNDDHLVSTGDFYHRDGRWYLTVSAFARLALGLDYEQADRFFTSGNTLDDLIWLVEDEYDVHVRDYVLVMTGDPVANLAAFLTPPEDPRHDTDVAPATTTEGEGR